MAKATLMDRTYRGIWRGVDVESTAADGLTISVHDLGEGATMNGDEYECWYKVSPDGMPAFCELVGIRQRTAAADLAKKYSGVKFNKLVELIEDAPMVRFSSYF